MRFYIYSFADSQALRAKVILSFTDKMSERVFLIVVLTRMTMQVDSVGAPPVPNVQPSKAEVVETENREISADEPDNSASSPSVDPGYSMYSTSSSIDQERPDNPKGLIINKTTLKQLLDAGTPKAEQHLDVVITKNSA